MEEEWFYLDDPDEPYSRKHKEIFPDFEKYYQYLDGDIYEEACYYQYKFPDKAIHEFHLDTNKLYARNSFISDTINEFLPGLSPEDRKVYQHIEKTVKKQYQNWLDKFNACGTYEELKKVCGNYEKSAFSEKKPLHFFCSSMLIMIRPIKDVWIFLWNTFPKITTAVAMLYRDYA